MPRPTRPTRPARLARAVAAALTLLILVVAVPVLLWHTIGNPLTGWSTLTAGDLSDTVVVDVLAAVAYLAWAQFALAAATETVAALTHTLGRAGRRTGEQDGGRDGGRAGGGARPSVRSGVRGPRLPGVFPGQQRLAHTLVAAVFLLGPTTQQLAVAHPTTLPATHTALTVATATATPGPTPGPSTPPATANPRPAAASTDRSEGPGAPATTAGTPQQEGTTTYVVRADGPGTYWDLAAHFLGHGDHWRTIWDLNTGRHQHDGSVMTDPGLLRPGWTVLIPTHPHHPGHPDQSGQVRVAAGDTLSGIAAAHGIADWHDVSNANAGRTEPDGTFTDPDHIEPGWTIDLRPTDQPAPVTPAPVNPAPVNPAPATTAPSTVPQPASPHPSPAPGTASPRHDNTTTTASPRDADASPTLTGTSPGATAAAQVATGCPAVSAPATGSPAAVSAPSTAQAALEPSAGGEGDESGVLATVTLGLGGGLLAGAAALALARYRRRQFRHRRPGRAVALTTRTPSTPGAPSPAPLTGWPVGVVEMDKALRTAGTGDVVWLDQALRGLTHHLTHPTTGTAAGVDPLAGLPDVVAACLTPDALELVLAEPASHSPGAAAAPGAWTVSADGTRWRLARTDPTGYDPARRPFLVAPYPALACVGYTASGQYWLLDLERVGPLRITGAPGRAVDLARFVAAELAHNTWSQHPDVTAAGLDDLAGLGPGRLTLTPPDQQAAAVHAAAQAASSNTALLEAAGTDVLTARLRGHTEQVWFPHILILAHHRDTTAPSSHPSSHLSSHADETAGELEHLVTTLDTQPTRTAVTVVLAGHLTAGPEDTSMAPDADAVGSGSGWTVRVDEAGTLHVPALGLEILAQGLPAAQAASLAHLVGAAAADLDDVPVRAADATADPTAGPGVDPAVDPVGAWTGFADATGAPRADVVTDDQQQTAAAEQVRRLVPPGGAPSDSVLPLPAAVYVETAATTVEDVAVLAPELSAGLRRRIEDADPTLDDDLAAWHDPDTTIARLRVLGSVEVRAVGSLPTDRPRRGWNTEVVALLAAHPRGLTAEQLGTALWPDDPDIATKTRPRQAVLTVRTWLATHPVTGNLYVPKAQTGVGGTGLYRVEGLLVDADLFRRLRLRGVARGPAGITDLEAALGLVTGIPYDHRRKRGYTWLADTPLDLEYTAMIVDVAHTVATHHLGAGHPDLAESAARAGLLAGGSDDITLLDLAAAADAQNRHTEADTWRQRVLDNHDAEIDEDLPPRTAAILFRQREQARTGAERPGGKSASR